MALKLLGFNLIIENSRIAQDQIWQARLEVHRMSRNLSRGLQIPHANALRSDCSNAFKQGIRWNRC